MTHVSLEAYYKTLALTLEQVDFLAAILPSLRGMLAKAVDAEKAKGAVS